MSQYIYHKADTRGHDRHEWLDSSKTFSFGSYYNPKRMGFGALRVLNDDILPGGKGFGSHPHDNMEIISIPLKGSLRHDDTAGNSAVAGLGQIQVMHAGSGLFHSEYNNSADETAEFLQIWLYPEELNTPPRYTLGTLPLTAGNGQLHTFIAPEGAGTIAVRKDVWFSYGTFDNGTKTGYDIRKQGNGAYAFVVKGSFSIDGKTVSERDGLGIWEAESIHIQALSNGAQLLIMDVPMNIEL